MWLWLCWHGADNQLPHEVKAEDDLCKDEDKVCLDDDQSILSHQVTCMARDDMMTPVMTPYCKKKHLRPGVVEVDVDGDPNSVHKDHEEANPMNWVGWPLKQRDVAGLVALTRPPTHHVQYKRTLKHLK